MGITYTDQVPSPERIFQFYRRMGWEPALGRTPEGLSAAMLGSWRVRCALEGDTLAGMGRVVSDGR